MITSLHLQALAKYKEINQSHPSNVECLRYLVHLCTELGRRDDAQKYMTELRKAEKAQAAEASAMTVAARTAAAGGMGNMGGGLPNGGGSGSILGGGAARGGQGFLDDGSPISPGLNVPVNKGKKVVAKEEAGGHDDWGNEELGDDLLPM
jgi:intraflagellar transport protein 88